jgi:hypothetical protein
MTLKDIPIVWNDLLDWRCDTYDHYVLQGHISYLLISGQQAYLLVPNRMSQVLSLTP